MGWAIEDEGGSALCETRLASLCGIDTDEGTGDLDSGMVEVVSAGFSVCRGGGRGAICGGGTEAAFDGDTEMGVF